MFLPIPNYQRSLYVPEKSSSPVLILYMSVICTILYLLKYAKLSKSFTTSSFFVHLMILSSKKIFGFWYASGLNARCSAIRRISSAFVYLVSFSKRSGKKGAGKTEIGCPDSVLIWRCIPYFRTILTSTVRELSHIQLDDENLQRTAFRTTKFRIR